jgi:poly(3-hydroxybutyrate) depolymerase
MTSLLTMPFVLLCSTLPSVACGCDAVGSEPQGVEWEAVSWNGGTTNVAIVRPSDGSPGPHPVIFALPWGGGTEDLVLGFVSTYWNSEAPSRGYYVVAPAVRGSTLGEVGPELLPAIFEMMDAELDYDPSSVALVGASNGGRGIFHAALAFPDRFRTMVGLPGTYSGDSANLAALSGKQVRLLVGEQDTGWVQGSESTLSALQAVGVSATLEIMEGQAHVLRLDANDLMDGIDRALGR